MKYGDLVNQAKGRPVFGSSLLVHQGDFKRNAENQLIRWQKMGKIWRLKRGVYTLPDELRSYPLSRWWVANQIYSPSYISMDSALSYYELIPENVLPTFSVTTAKTATFSNAFGKFSYQTISKNRFFGFKEIPDEQGILIRLATPEKALLDHIYFNRYWQPKINYLEEDLRLQNLKILSPTYLNELAQKFESKKISEALKIILTLRKKS